MRAIYLVACACHGILDRAIIRQQRLGIEDPEQVNFPYEKGRLYAFFLEGFKIERSQFSGWIGDRGSELIETGEEALGAPVGAPAPINLALCKQLHSPHDKEQSRLRFCLWNTGERQSSFHVDVHF